MTKFLPMTKILCILDILAAMMLIMACASPQAATAQKLQAYHNKDKGGYHFWLYSPPEKADTIVLKPQDKGIARPFKSTHSRHEQKQEQHPLILFLHGASLCGRDLARVRRYGPLDAIDRGRKVEAYVLAPQNPGGSWNPRKLMKLVEWASRTHDIDTTRIYVMGMSLGGYGTLDFAAAYPDRIAAAMAICGGSTTKEHANLSRLPLWILHGTADRAVPVSCSDAVVAAMKKAGPTPRLIYSRLKGYNHGQPARIFYMSETYKWLLSHRLTDADRPVTTGITINTTNIPKAYSDLHAKQPMSVHGRPHVEALSHEEAGYRPDSTESHFTKHTPR